jgi:hypothetical protein
MDYSTSVHEVDDFFESLALSDGGYIDTLGNYLASAKNGTFLQRLAHVALSGVNSIRWTRKTRTFEPSR